MALSAPVRVRRLLPEPGEEPLQLPLPGRQQRVHLAAPRHLGTRADRADRVGGDPLVGHVQRGQVVALDGEHLIGVVAEEGGCVGLSAPGCAARSRR
ncbi:hypothetical protein ACTOB_002977 [Actinoplanes oblitus]|uniref:Uncharacterized protein n=1 Tax=Actinoplanes oblitus TaxID=3040509 RepID=A0ABY8WR99_9ACTN|nr:hypothetical protein [Actinoplanes oblitus]WIM99327.1 hypothetical protein ACTOB_002977 [Actinoplanes oblitus]